MPKIDVSIIIVNWNTRDLLIDCIYSLIKKTHRYVIEIIVSDNGSTDGSVKAVKRFFPKVTIIRNNTNLGFAKANNVGIKRAKGKYICLVNSDIIALENSLDTLVDFLEANEKVGAVGPMTFGAELDYRPNCRKFPSLGSLVIEASGLYNIFPDSRLMQGRLMKHLSMTEPSKIDVLSGCFFLIRKSVVKKVGLLDEIFFIYGEDKDWCKRINEAGYSTIFLPTSKVIHLEGASSSAAPLRFRKEMLKSDVLYWQKHFNIMGQLCYISVKILHFIIRIAAAYYLKFIAPSNSRYKQTYFDNRELLRFILNRPTKSSP